MPIHDWSRVKAGTSHNFHVLWTSTLTNRLNAGLLPPGFFAMAEQVIGGPEPDVVSSTRSRPGPSSKMVASPWRGLYQPPSNAQAGGNERYARKANRIAIHHELGNVVAVIE